MMPGDAPWRRVGRKRKEIALHRVLANDVRRVGDAGTKSDEHTYGNLVESAWPRVTKDTESLTNLAE